MSNSGNRLKRHGFTVKCVELKCPRCKRRLNCAVTECPQLKEGKVPFCYDCLKEGNQCIMEVRYYTSGPIDLHV